MHHLEPFILLQNTAALKIPFDVSTSASTVGFPLESIISRPLIDFIEENL
tara:strand:- start:472 stop:621 length:150 start_codon:yes stop_codon:yes gene_type:complete